MLTGGDRVSGADDEVKICSSLSWPWLDNWIWFWKWVDLPEALIVVIVISQLIFLRYENRPVMALQFVLHFVTCHRVKITKKIRQGQKITEISLSSCCQISCEEKTHMHTNSQPESGVLHLHLHLWWQRDAIVIRGHSMGYKNPKDGHQTYSTN